MAKYWIGVASREHVRKAALGGFMQVCHGKAEPLRRMKGGDGVIYYSPTETFGEKTPCRCFTAIGKISAEEPYPFAMSPDFVPWRRNVCFYPCQEIEIEPLLEALSFIENKRCWGFPFRRGCFEIPGRDFSRIAAAMGVVLDDC